LVVFGINLREKVSQKPLRVVRDNSASDASEIPRTALKPKGLPPETVGSLVEASEWALWVLSASEGGYSLLAGSLSLVIGGLNQSILLHFIFIFPAVGCLDV
jgi:hypothetical protein